MSESTCRLTFELASIFRLQESRKEALLFGDGVDEHHVEGLVEEGRAQLVRVHLEAARLALAEEEAAVRLQCAVNHHGWEVQEANGHCRLFHLVKVLGQHQLMDVELELEEVLSRRLCLSLLLLLLRHYFELI